MRRRLRLSRFPRARLAPVSTFAAVVCVAAGMAAGCSATGIGTSGASMTCGRARTGVGVPVRVKIGHGPVSCATAMTVENSYAALVRAGAVHGNGGGAPVRVHGWICQGDRTPEVARTGQVSACRRSGAEIAAILLPASAPPVST